MKLQPGNRVLWWHDGEATKATVDRLYKNRVRIKTADFAAVTVGIDEVELVPLVEKKLPPSFSPDESGERATATPNNLPPNSLPPNNLPPNNLPPNSLPPNKVPPNSWIETKTVRGQTYNYARWREEVEVDGVKRKVKRSRYLEKAISHETD
jgi:hypothetical protein